MLAQRGQRGHVVLFLTRPLRSMPLCFHTTATNIMLVNLYNPKVLMKGVFRRDLLQGLVGFHVTWLRSWPRLEVVSCCLAHSARPRICMLRTTPQSCCGWSLVLATWWRSQCSLFPQTLIRVGKVSCILQGPLLFGVVGTPLLLQLLFCGMPSAYF